MRCPSCGASNPNDATVCMECGASLTPEQNHTNEQVEESVEQTQGPANQSSANVARQLEEETRLIQEETRLISQETTLLEDQMIERSGAAKSLVNEPEDELEPEPEPEPEPAPEKTVVRPSAQPPEEHFIVRNTRDYDHDAQSVNIAGNAANFETLKAPVDSQRLRRDPYERSSRKGGVPGEGNSRSKLRPLLAALLVALVLGGGAGVLTYGMELWGGKTVPSVVAESQANAEARLRDKGLEVTVATTLADDAIGLVVSQEPEAGERIPEGSNVTIYIAEARTVPEVVGLNEEEAQAALAEMGAEKIRVDVVPSQEWDGTVIAVSPEVGSVFLAREEVVLTVAGQYHVPDVLGKKESDAVEAIEAAGLKSHVTYVESSQTVRTVVETVPGPGEVIHSSEAVEVKVSSPYPSDIHHLAEFFSHSSQDVDAYLEKEQFSLGNGFIDSHGNALAVYSASDGSKITFSSQPYVRSLTFPKEGSSNVLATGAPIAGVRFDLPSSEVPKEANKEAVEKIAELCGFEGLKDTCDEKTITKAAGAPAITATFYCGSGKMSDVVWTILVINNGGSMSASVTCAREGIYSSSDLAQNGGRVCDFVAYQEVYKSGAYAPVRETTNDNGQDGTGQQGNGQQGDQQQGNQQPAN